MSLARLWVIDPSVSTAEEQGVAEVLHDWSGESSVLRPCLDPADGPGPDTGYDTDGIVLLGSSASVHDAPAWLPSLASWLAPLVRGEVVRPLLGICFGHQMVAHLAGAPVGFLDADHAKAVGVEQTMLDSSRLLPGRHELRVVVSHREIVERVPAGFRHVAERPRCAVDGLEHQKLPVFTFQFHPEARGDFAERAGFDRALIDQRLRDDTQRLLGGFRRIVRDTKKEPAV